jgi:hypothetical protein
VAARLACGVPPLDFVAKSISQRVQALGKCGEFVFGDVVNLPAHLLQLPLDGLDHGSIIARCIHGTILSHPARNQHGISPDAL